MKQITHYLWAIFFALILNTSLKAQVTIGLVEEPAQGALLQLKDIPNITDGSVNSLKGLNMPRVELKAINALTMGSNVINDAPSQSGASTVWKDHTGLVVYNMSEDDPFCKGLYVWDSQQWQRMGEKCFSLDLLFPDDIIYFASGHNGSAISPKDLTVKWLPASATLNWKNENEIAFNRLTFGVSGVTPLPWTSTQTVTLEPEVINPFYLETNPFYTLKSKFVVTATESGKTLDKSVQLNQTNKAILINGKLNPDQVSLTSSATLTAAVQANAEWTVSILPETNPAISSLSLTSGGSELYNGTGLSQNITYKVTASGSLARYSYLTLSDVNTPKRFNETTLTVVQCSGLNDITLEQYRDLWESSYGLDPENLEPGSSGNLSKNTNEVQWHYDQDGNVFFSSLFGDKRWMINNLRATSYAPGSPTNPDLSISYAIPAAPDTYTAARYAYPNPSGSTNPNDKTQFDQRERLGLLYNWAAATGNQNPSTGNQYDGNHPSYQGICPDGWHLPSAKEWKNLIEEIEINYGKYSSNDDGAKTANSMKDICERTANTAKSLNMLNGGFNILLAGLATTGKMLVYNDRAGFWASGSVASNAACMQQLNFSEAIMPVMGNTFRYGLVSVRCVKD